MESATEMQLSLSPADHAITEQCGAAAGAAPCPEGTLLLHRSNGIAIAAQSRVSPCSSLRTVTPATFSCHLSKNILLSTTQHGTVGQSLKDGAGQKGDSSNGP